jgi:hypothetical protein
MTILSESHLNFEFDETSVVLKFDETNFYQKHFMRLQTSKGVDFLVLQQNTIYLVEVKNFRGYETDPATKARLKTNSDESLALEVSQKVRDSIACLRGALANDKEVFASFYPMFVNRSTEFKVILFLEGRFNNEQVMFREITDSMKSMLGWLTKKVIVENVNKVARNSHSIYTVTHQAYLPGSN